MMQDLKRPLTVRFPTRGLGWLVEGDVLQVLTHKVKVENIKAIQITEDECRVTVTDVTAKQTLIASHVTIKDNKIVMSDVSRSTTKVTNKDAPYEMDDTDIESKPRNFKEIVEEICDVVKCEVRTQTLVPVTYPSTMLWE